MKSNLVKMLTLCMCMMVVGFASQDKQPLKIQNDKIVLENKMSFDKKQKVASAKQDLKDKKLSNLYRTLAKKDYPFGLINKSVESKRPDTDFNPKNVFHTSPRKIDTRDGNVSATICSDYWSSETYWILLDTSNWWAWGANGWTQHSAGPDACEDWSATVPAGEYLFIVGDSYGDGGGTADISVNGEYVGTVTSASGDGYSNYSGLYEAQFWFNVTDAPAEGCADGEYEDCSGDGDCAPGSWVGDGWCDGTDQPYGFDLTCHDNDGGDCAAADDGGSEGCADDEFTCNDGSCIPGSWECDVAWCDCGDCEDEADCAPTSGVVTFDLDGLDDCGFVSVTGTFDGWSGWGANNDTGMSAEIANGSHEFIILCVNTEGEWWNDIWGNSTIYNAPIDGSCWNGNYDYANYVLNVDGDATVSYCAGTCDAECASEGCADGEYEDCSGDGDCAPGSWVGDGWCDGEDQPYGFDLTCHDNDGGDCAAADDGGSEGCADDEFTCNDGTCIPGSWECDVDWCDCGDCEDEADCAPTSGVVTFDLDGLDDCGFVSVTGTFDDWSGWGANTDTGMSAEIANGSHEFIILCVNTEGEWWNDIWGNSTIYNAPIDGSCWNGNYDYANYVLNVDGDATVSYCAGTCDAVCASEGCADGEYEDCSGDGDCAPGSWVGDGWCDGTDQPYGFDLTCHDNDGGDCATADDGGDDGSADDGGSEGCPDGTYEDCSGDGDCAPASWVGDGWCDGTDQPYGYDLTCHDNDGGDCAAADDGGSDDGGSEGCAEGEYDCGADNGGCIPGSWECDVAWCDCYDCVDESDCGSSDDGGDDGSADDGGDDGGSACAEGTVEDCSGDGDCAPLSWVGDGWCDGTDQPYGYDLTCYDNDAGDCDGRANETNKIHAKAKLAAINHGELAGKKVLDMQSFSRISKLDAKLSNKLSGKSLKAVKTVKTSVKPTQSIIKDIKNPAKVIKPEASLNRKDVQSTLKRANSVKLIQTENGLSYEADGFVGFEMTLNHGDDFKIDMAKGGFSGYNTVGNTTKLVIVNNETTELFSSEGEFTITDVLAGTSDGVVLSAEIASIPSVFGLSSAYPNPFNPSTSVELSVPSEGFVSVKVFNLMGQVVSTLHEGNLTANSYSFAWNAENMASGMYLLKAESAGNIAIQKIMLMK